MKPSIAYESLSRINPLASKVSQHFEHLIYDVNYFAVPCQISMMAFPDITNNRIPPVLLYAACCGFLGSQEYHIYPTEKLCSINVIHLFVACI